MASSSNIVFKGFSTAGGLVSQNYTYYDIALIKRDLMNHFNTKVGERVMRPAYGCKIWDYLMEPLVTGTRDVIVAEAVRICQSDSRVTVQNVQVFASENGIRIELTLLYKPYDVINTFAVDFDSRQTANNI
jgi:phage baseplate assembly protein W